MIPIQGTCFSYLKNPVVDIRKLYPEERSQITQVRVKETKEKTYHYTFVENQSDIISRFFEIKRKEQCFQLKTFDPATGVVQKIMIQDPQFSQFNQEWNEHYRLPGDLDGMPTACLGLLTMGSLGAFIASLINIPNNLKNYKLWTLLLVSLTVSLVGISIFRKDWIDTAQASKDWDEKMLNKHLSIIHAYLTRAKTIPNITWVSATLS